MSDTSNGRISEERALAVVKELCRNAGLPMDGLDDDAPVSAALSSPPFPIQQPPESMKRYQSEDEKAASFEARSIGARAGWAHRPRAPAKPKRREPPPPAPQRVERDMTSYEHFVSLVNRGLTAMRFLDNRQDTAPFRELLSKALMELDPSKQAALIDQLHIAVEAAEAAAGIRRPPAGSNGQRPKN